jgi:NADH:ubiquinone oxidoreductase subunit
MTIGTKITSFLTGKLVGKDIFGNRYYVEKRQPKSGKVKRWVIYSGMAEASKVPPLWHAWLHYMTNELPTEMNAPHYFWQKEHQPNLTGTSAAYKPKGHLEAGGKRTSSSSDYDAWKP